jgi:hypothetical protein
MRWYNDNKGTFWVGVVVLAVVVYWIAQNWHPIPPQCDQVTLGLVTSGPNDSGSPRPAVREPARVPRRRRPAPQLLSR